MNNPNQRGPATTVLVCASSTQVTLLRSPWHHGDAFIKPVLGFIANEGSIAEYAAWDDADEYLACAACSDYLPLHAYETSLHADGSLVC